MQLPEDLLARILRLVIGSDVLCVTGSIGVNRYCYSDPGVMRVCLKNSVLRKLVDDIPLALLNVSGSTTRLPLIVRPIRVVWWHIVISSDYISRIQEMMEWLRAYERRDSISVFRLKMVMSPRERVKASEAHSAYSQALQEVSELLQNDCKVISKFL